MMSLAERAETKESMRRNGQRKPIVLLDDLILDGRNRYELCLELGLEPRTRPYNPSEDGPDPLSFVIDENLNRRQLSDGQRAVVAAEIASLRPGDNQHSEVPPNGGTSQTEAAARLNVSRRAVERATVVRDHGAPEVKAAAREGVLPVATAEALASLPEVEQQAIILNLPLGSDGKLTPAARKQLAPIVKKLRAEKQRDKKSRRDAREIELGRKHLAAPEKKYGVAIEDFEWDHEPWSRETGMDRHPSNHYPTATDAHTPEEIVARTAGRIKCLADECVLYFWTTIPHEAIAHRVLALRGFTYVTQRVWGKLRPGKGRGPGYWVSGEHEILLIAVRGKVVPPATAHFRSYFEAPVREHSEKPDQQYEHAEYHFPNVQKIEINARRRRTGWEAWGNEIQERPNQPDTVAPSRESSTRNSTQDDELELPNFLRRGHPDCMMSPR
jgi:N6-adenosine-specific RNA methylase IME4